MKPFSIKFDGAEARITTNIEAGGSFHKKVLTATCAEDLWDGMQRLLKLDGMPEEAKLQAVEHISKYAERACIEEAIPAWLAKGNKIKICPAADRKLELSQAEKDDILAELGLFGAEAEPEELAA